MNDNLKSFQEILQWIKLSSSSQKSRYVRAEWNAYRYTACVGPCFSSFKAIAKNQQQE